jgi:hypothetical protein
VRYHLTCAAVVALSMVTCSAAAQQPQTPVTSAPAAVLAAKSPPVLLKVQIVISRHQGEKTISSQPYMLTATADGPGTNLRMGINMPVASATFAPASAPAGAPADVKPLVSYNYRDVGTNIDCNARSIEGGRYLLDISLEDSWVSAEDAATAVKGLPQFRSFRVSHETTILRDGQTAQLTTAADKANGETVRVDVTMNVIK